MFVHGYGMSAGGDAAALGLGAGCCDASAAAGVAFDESSTSAIARKGKRRIVVLSRERLLYVRLSPLGSDNPAGAEMRAIKAKR
jgi:hypothetical protein